MKKSILFCSLFLFICGCGYISYLRDPFVDIPQFYQVDERLYRGGRPNQDGIYMLREKGIKTVITLQGPSSARSSEAQLVKTLGMDFVTIPMSVDEVPADEDILLFMNYVLDPEKQPIFVHCASGRDRTGVLVAVYRVLVYGWGPKEAYDEAKRYGFWPYRGDNVLKNFIHQIKDKEIYFTETKKLKRKYGIN
jgi:protein tyrosine/serine phosphatase